MSNALITIAAARLLSPREFGVFGLVFTIYIFTVGGCRDVIGHIILSGSQTLSGAQASAVTGAVALAGLVGAALLSLVGVLLGGVAGRTIICLAGVFPGLVVQDMCRHWFIAAGRPSTALVNDVLWLLVMAPGIAAVAIFSEPSATALVLVWGSAGSLAAVAACIKASARPNMRSGRKWIRDNRQTIRSFAGEFVSVRGATQVALLGLAPIAGVTAVGATRAVYVLFGPLTIVISGLYLAAIPLSREMAVDPDRLQSRLAIMACVAGAAAALWGAALMVMPDRAGEVILGSTWPLAKPLVLATAVGFVASSAIVGPLSGLRALYASRYSLRARRWSLPLILVLTLMFALPWGAQGYAIGLALAQLIMLVALWDAFRKANSERTIEVDISLSRDAEVLGVGGEALSQAWGKSAVMDSEHAAPEITRDFPGPERPSSWSRESL